MIILSFTREYSAQNQLSIRCYNFFVRKLLLSLLKKAFTRNLFVNLIHKLEVYANKSLFASLGIKDLEDLIFQMIPRFISSEHLIRKGNQFDGGYVICNKITSGSTYLLSLGVGDNITFEIELNTDLAHTIFVDHSILALPCPLPNSTFINKKVSTIAGFKTINLQECLDMIPKNVYAILKIDIEGSEWDSLANLELTELSRFTQIVGEFHNFHGIYQHEHLIKVLNTLKKINKTHVNVNLHPNNWSNFKIINGIAIPDVVELTFIRKDLFDSLTDQKTGNVIHYGVNHLNTPNNPSSPEYRLCFFNH